jgi:hypothetical protein
MNLWPKGQCNPAKSCTFEESKDAFVQDRETGIFKPSARRRCSASFASRFHHRLTTYVRLESY